MQIGMKADQAAESLGIGIRKFRELVAKGEIACTVIDGLRLFQPADLKEFLDRHRRPATTG